MSMFSPPTSGGFSPKVNRPTDQVKQFQQKELGSVLEGRPGATASPAGTVNLAAGQARPGSIQPRSFSAVGQLVDSNHQASMARIQKRSQLAALSKTNASDMSLAAGRGASPQQYGQPRQSYTKKLTTPYAQQGIPSGGFGGRSGIRPEASQAFDSMEASYAQVFGGRIPVNEGFRSYERQVQLWNDYKAGRGNLAAKPGTSNHGGGIAVDLGGPFQNANSAQHRWLRVNGPKFGWHWTGGTFSQKEPWHWEYHP